MASKTIVLAYERKANKAIRFAYINLMITHYFFGCIASHKISYKTDQTCFYIHYLFFK